MKRIGSLSLSTVLVSLVAFSAAANESNRLKVLTSFLPIYCFAASVAGEWADVENLLPANVEPHDYQLSRKDVQKINSAGLIIINGLGLETWLDKVLRHSALTKARPIVESSAGLKDQLIFESPQLYPASSSALAGTGPTRERREFPNPHVWLDPQLACYCVTN